MPPVVGAPIGCGAAVFGVGLLTDATLIDYEKRRGRTRGLSAFGIALTCVGAAFAGGPAVVSVWPATAGPITVAQALIAVVAVWLWFVGRPVAGRLRPRTAPVQSRRPTARRRR